MTLKVERFVGIITVLSLLSSGSALFVTMKIKYEIATFKNEFLTELDTRYIRKEEYSIAQQAAEREAVASRQRTQADLVDIRVAARREKDDLMLALKDILAKLNK